MLSDIELAARVASSDNQAAFQELVERHHTAIRAFLRRLTAGDLALADDLAQETFLLAYRKIRSWKASGKFISWLHTIAYRQFIQHCRKHSRQTVMAEVPDAGHDSRDAIDAELMTQKLMALVNEEERACITLSFAGGMSHAEIENVTGLPLGTVKSRIFRGRQKLLRWLQENDYSVQKEAQGA